MTIDIDLLETQHSDLDDSFRRHAFEILRKGVALEASEIVASSPSEGDSGQRTLEVLLQRGWRSWMATSS